MNDDDRGRQEYLSELELRLELRSGCHDHCTRFLPVRLQPEFVSDSSLSLLEEGVIKPWAEVDADVDDDQPYSTLERPHPLGNN